MNKSPKHILFLSRWYPNRYDSMLGLFVQRHALAVAQHHKVSVIHISPCNAAIAKELKHTDHQGVDEWIYYYSKDGFIRKILSPINYVYGMAVAYRAVVKFNGKPDMNHVNILTRMGIMALILKKRHKIPYIITEHWSRYQSASNSYKGRIRKWATKWVVKKADAVTTVSNHLKKAMNKHDLQNENWEITPNVVDTDFFKPTDTPKGDDNNRKKTFIHISCFEERSKNMSGILNTFAKLKEKEKAFKLLMVGDGMDMEITKTLAKELKFNNDELVFAGLKEGKALLDLIHQSDALIMFSRYENLPVVILEAFACGIPVISSDVGGIKEFFPQDAGKLIESENQEQFLETLSTFIDDLMMYNKKEIREYAVEHFSMKAIGEQFDAIYKGIWDREDKKIK